MQGGNEATKNLENLCKSANITRLDPAQIISLIDDGADFNNITIKIPFTPDLPLLHWAAMDGHVALVEALLAKGEEVDRVTQNGSTALHIACKNAKVEIINILLGKNANVNLGTRYNATPLHFAALSGNSESVAELLKANNINVNARDDRGETPLHYAASEGDSAVVAVLLGANNIDVNPRNDRGETPLHSATLEGNSEVVAELLKAENIDINAIDNKGFTAISGSAVIKDSNTFALLLQKGAKVTLRDVMSTRLHKLDGYIQFSDAIGLETTYMKQNAMKLTAFAYLGCTAVSLCIGINIPVISNLNSMAASICTKLSEILVNAISRMVE